MLIISSMGFLFLFGLYLALDAQLFAIVPRINMLETTRARVNASEISLHEEIDGIISSTQKEIAASKGMGSTPLRESNAAIELTSRREISTSLESQSPETSGTSAELFSDPKGKAETPFIASHATPPSDEFYSSFHGSPSSLEAPRDVLPTTPTISDSDTLQRRVPQTSNLSEIYKNFAIYTEKCRIRDYDFNDPTILQKYFSDAIAHCKPDAKPFVFYPKMNLTAGHSCIGFDADISLAHFNATADDWKCTYTECVRAKTQVIIDGNFDWGVTESFHPGDCPPYEFLWIKCSLESQQITNYTQPLLLPLVKPAKKFVRRNNLGRKPLNVLVVGMDSVSRLNAHRQFPETLKFLRTKKNLVELFGYNKIGLNSAPNQIPLLTGVKYLGDYLQARVTNNYFDNETRYLWDDYESRGYRTMFYEEQWKYGLFIYPSTNGFKEVGSV